MHQICTCLDLPGRFPCPMHDPADSVTITTSNRTRARKDIYDYFKEETEWLAKEMAKYPNPFMSE